jgi:hypothetical protein
MSKEPVSSVLVLKIALTTDNDDLRQVMPDLVLAVKVAAGECQCRERWVLPIDMHLEVHYCNGVHRSELSGEVQTELWLALKGYLRDGTRAFPAKDGK